MPTMINLHPVEIRDDGTIVVGSTVASVSPSESFRLAEQLIRMGARRALAEEVAEVDRREPVQ